jgi:hypothetical protein
VPREGTIRGRQDLFIFIRVGTYVQRGSKNCFVVVVLLLGTLVRILHYCPISQPCPAALPGSLARQPCPAALPGSLARQPCPAALPGSLARQPCLAALHGCLDQQFDQFRSDLMRALARSFRSHCTTVAGPDRFKHVF